MAAVAVQAVADKVAAEPDIRLGVVEVVERQALLRGDFHLDPVERDLGDLHESPGPGVGICVRIKIALGADEGV